MAALLALSLINPQRDDAVPVAGPTEFDPVGSGFELCGECTGPWFNNKYTNGPFVVFCNLGVAGPSTCSLATSCWEGQSSAICVPDATTRTFAVATQREITPGVFRYKFVQVWRRPQAGPIVFTPGIRWVPPVAAPFPRVVAGVLPSRPIVLPGVNPLPLYPEASDRGYRPPMLGGFPIGHIPTETETPRFPVGRRNPISQINVPVIPDVRVFPPDVEQKHPTGSSASRIYTAWLALMSQWGVANSFIDGLWNSLPSWARTRNARTFQKFADLARNLDLVDYDVAAREMLNRMLGIGLAGHLYGTALETLSQSGGAAGFHLFRAWATGEYAHGTFHRFSPTRYRADTPGRLGMAETVRPARYLRQRFAELRALRRAEERLRKGSGSPRERRARYRRDVRRIREYYSERNIARRFRERRQKG